MTHTIMMEWKVKQKAVTEDNKYTSLGPVVQS